MTEGLFITFEAYHTLRIIKRKKRIKDTKEGNVKVQHFCAAITCNFISPCTISNRFQLQCHFFVHKKTFKKFWYIIRGHILFLKTFACTVIIINER